MNRLKWFVIVGILLLLSSTAYAAFWNVSWDYRRNESINNIAKDFYNFGYYISLNMSAEYAASKVNRTGKDIRFTYWNTTSATESEISHWIEKCDFSIGDNLTVRVNVSYMANDTDTTIYMYYGNLDIETTSDITTLFIMGEDFERCPLGWIGDNCGWVNYSTSTASENEVSDVQARDTKSYLWNWTSNYANCYKQYADQTDIFIAEYWIYSVRGRAGWAFNDGTAYSDLNGFHVFHWDISGTNLKYYSDATAEVLVAVPLNTWAHVEVIIKPTATQNIKIYVDGVKKYDGDPRGNVGTYKYLHPGYYSNSYELFFDNFIVRQYASPVPTITIGAEETGTTTTTTTVTTTISADNAVPTILNNQRQWY